MSSDIQVHKCMCDVKKLGIVDGDTDSIYCANCEGVLGTFDDFTIEDIRRLMQGE